MKEVLIATGIALAGMIALIALTSGLFALGGWIGTLLGADDWVIGGLGAVMAALLVYLVVVGAMAVYGERERGRRSKR